MAGERLSKLQKWILEQTYKINVLHEGSVIGTENSIYYRSVAEGRKSDTDEEYAYKYFECWIYEKYYGFAPYINYGSGISETSEYKKAHVTVYRAVQNMSKKGLIYLKDNYSSYKMKNWSISAKGIDALKLKKVGEINASV